MRTGEGEDDDDNEAGNDNDDWRGSALITVAMTINMTTSMIIVLTMTVRQGKDGRAGDGEVLYRMTVTLCGEV